MLRVALTGGIACGKSVVARLLEEKGCSIYSADAAARDLMAPGRPAWKKITARFGRGIVEKDRTISRPRLAALLFSDPAARRFVNSVVHPLVIAAQDKAIARVERLGLSRIFVSEAALTFEAGVASRFDKVVVVDCPRRLQLKRLMERSALSRADALRRIGAQLPAAEKRRRADYVIDTSGSLAQTIDQTERMYAALLQDCEIKQAASARLGRTRRSALPPKTKRARRNDGKGKIEKIRRAAKRPSTWR